MKRTKKLKFSAETIRSLESAPIILDDKKLEKVFGAGTPSYRDGGTCSGSMRPPC